MSDFDRYSIPMSPSWVGKEGGQRFTVSNEGLRDVSQISRGERVLEVGCGRSLIAVVHPRGPRHLWRLQLIDRDEHLLPTDDPPVDLTLFNDLGEEPPPDAARTVGFKCVCGRFHVLDRDAVLEAAERLEPRGSKSAQATRIDFRDVARVVRQGGT